jgi:hypothetical protein
MAHRITKVLTAGDSYRTLADLMGFAPSRNNPIFVGEGTLKAQGNGFTWLITEPGDDAPAATADGDQIATGGGTAWGPAREVKSSLIDLSNTWVRNTTAGQNAKVVLVGVLA